MNLAIVLAFLFFIGCVTGWGIEVVFRRFYIKNNPEHRWINPGFLTGPWLPIYGIGMCGMYGISEFLGHLLASPEYLAEKAAGAASMDLGALNADALDVIDVIIILLVMTVAMTVIELIAGLYFTRVAHVWLWDYRNEKLNYKGVICLKFSCFWGILGCFYYFVINPYVLDGIIWLSQHLTFSFFIGAFFGIFAVDMVQSTQTITKVKNFAEEKEIAVRYEEFKEDIRKRREELDEKKRFFLAYRPEHSIRKSLEEYAEKRGLLKEEIQESLQRSIEEFSRGRRK